MLENLERQLDEMQKNVAAKIAIGPSMQAWRRDWYRWHEEAHEQFLTVLVDDAVRLTRLQIDLFAFHCPDPGVLDRGVAAVLADAERWRHRPRFSDIGQAVTYREAVQRIFDSVTDSFSKVGQAAQQTQEAMRQFASAWAASERSS